MVKVLAACVSLALSLGFADNAFVPLLRVLANTFDAFRYHHFAARLAEVPLNDLGRFAENLPFEQPGYVLFLSTMYRLLGDSPYIGCAVNWALCVVAGLMLCDCVKDRVASTVPLFCVWILGPDTIYWCGSTTKEPLAALLLILGVWSVIRKRWGVFVGSAVLAIWVRSAQLPILAAAALSSFPRLRRFRIAPLGVAFSLLALYVSSSADDELSPLGRAGHDRLVHDTVFADNTSQGSILLGLGSENRMIDALAVLPRGVVNVIAPSYINPFALPLVSITGTSWLLWAGGVLAAGALLMVMLQGNAASGDETPREVHVLRAATLIAILVLGFSGIIHERYHSIVVPTLLPWAACCLKTERLRYGYVRLAFVAGFGGVLMALTYAALKT
ncbi:MAG: hypothetical protein V4529_17040 [Gemmatimonadota bacterium]